jgi:hypothetical protein
MRQEFRRRLLYLAAGLWTVAVPPSAAVAQTENPKTGGGITVYLGVMPAAMIQGHPKGHPEQAMHGGVPRGRYAYHVMAAMFDAESGERIENAKVEARVSSQVFTSAMRPLEPMQIAGTVTYGNYFTISANEPYQILISVSRDSQTAPVALEFSHEHRTR